MPIDKLYDEKEVAQMLGISPATLRTWRSRPTSRSIAFTKIGRKVKYKESELKKYIDKHTVK